MRKKNIVFLHCLFLLSITAFSQHSKKEQWTDSVFNSLTDEQRIAQLMVVRTSTLINGEAVFLNDQIDSLIKRYNIGAVCLFQGTPQKQAELINRIQKIAATPIMVCVDAEWGLGMRFSGVQNFPYQLTMGALHDAGLAYKVGKAIANQCLRMGIHVNYAPVVDINNNPDNPVIGVRSFGEDKYKVALFGTRIMQGMQDAGIMACAKHFPGHGDVSVDSHLDLPVIHKSIGQLNNLELYPFRELFSHNVGSVMVAHLSIPAIDSTANRPTSISYDNITGLMRNKMGYTGLSFTDALEMQGVKKYYPNGEASVQSIIAGNDMLCLPENVPQSIEKIKQAIADKRLTWENIYIKCKKVLQAKYDYVISHTEPIDTNHLINDLNKDVAYYRKQVALNALTVLNLQKDFFPLLNSKKKQLKNATDTTIAYVSINGNGQNTLAKELKKYPIKIISIAAADSLKPLDTLQFKKYKKIIIGLHGINRNPQNNFGIIPYYINAIRSIEAQCPQAVLMIFGNCYSIKNFCNNKNLVACYEDDSVFQQVAAEWLMEKFKTKGSLPVTVCDQFKYGSGIIERSELKVSTPQKEGFNENVLTETVDSIANDAIKKQATPGCVVAIFKNGKLIFEKGYGFQNYDSMVPVTTNTIYDLASVTKVAATTLAIMKLWEEGKINLKRSISDYLPWLKGSNKEELTLENLLMHQAGLVPFIPFYKNAMDENGHPRKEIFSNRVNDEYRISVADTLFMRSQWLDTMYNQIKTSTVNSNELKYVYSDNDFILLGNVVSAISGMPLDEYVKKEFYDSLGMTSTYFKPFEHFSISEIAPTEQEKQFRQQLIHGYVHDPGAAMMGNVAGHAGLFSNVYDLGILFQMLLNGGTFNGKRYFKKETIDWFTSYQTPVSRRGLGFDKPEKNNKELDAVHAYPCISPSPSTFGHTGFTGTCVWADPKYNLVYIFLSNRVCPSSDNNKLIKMNVRSNIQEAIYKAMK